ncbi:MAG TPA: bifunctional serine/threonine-protein kinase/formylglycine-generating enzyme family protein [Gemmataceae bacterium]|nr:bifunctional serine/threonine-protein kinase/formylglycine-generating enzyme family protein [Gemmataceae bacterium]
MTTDPPPDPNAARLPEGPPTDPGVVLVAGASPLPDYKLVRRLGRGGCGEVWMAHGPRGIPVALKFIPLDEPAGPLEVRALDLMKDIRHPHLLGLFGAWERDRHLIVAMQLAEGSVLDRLRQATSAGQAGIPGGELRKYVGEAAEGIDHLNGERGIQHRDIKPHNLLLVGGSVQVADFGLARVLAHTFATQTGVNTPHYAPPESFEEKLTRWSDQYSLAVTYCQLRGNRLPFQGTAHQVINAHLTKPPDLTMLPPAERPVVARALRKDPKERWPDCRTFSGELDSRMSGADDGSPADAPDTLLPEVTNSLGMRLVLVPGGAFWMGDRGQQARVQVPRDFYLGAYPVTQGQWQAVMGGNPSYFSRGRGGADEVKGLYDDELKQLPVEQVSWEDAREFLRRLNAREKAGGLLYRLPAEAEWEYACRGGASSQSDCAFDFYPARPANDLSAEQANFDGRQPAGGAPPGKYLGRPSKVGSYPPNRLGLYDMHGNVWEWCEDPFEAGGSARVLRGGSWHDGGPYCRASHRHGREQSFRNIYLGFRIAAVPSGA